MMGNQLGGIDMVDLKVKLKAGSREERISGSDVRSDDGAVLLVHHATFGRFDVDDMAPFSHFGTRAAARQRVASLSGSPPDNDCRLISAFLDVKAPLLIDDVNDDHSVEHFAELIDAARPGLLAPCEIEGIFEMEPGQAEEHLVSTLLEAGFDGLCYRNRHEDPGSLSWVILDPGQIIVERDGPMSGSRDPWELSEGDYTGPLVESDMFEIDGRHEDYDHLWEDLDTSRYSLPVLARNDGWEVRWLVDWEPRATMGLFDPSGASRGFYMGGQLWIDADVRGAGRSALMINAAADLLGGCPAQNDKGMGFSPAGAAAHRAARRKAITLAMMDGHSIDRENEPEADQGHHSPGLNF